jgi:hypothetical protein
LLDHYEARWVVCGFTQRTGVDFGETFTSVIKLVTIRTVLTIAASRQWPTRKLDVSNAFLHGTHQEHVLYQQPTCFVDPACPNAVCLLDKSLYGLWQARGHGMIALFLLLSSSVSNRHDLIPRCLSFNVVLIPPTFFSMWTTWSSPALANFFSSGY